MPTKGIIGSKGSIKISMSTGTARYIRSEGIICSKINAGRPRRARIKRIIRSVDSAKSAGSAESERCVGILGIKG